MHRLLGYKLPVAYAFTSNCSQWLLFQKWSKMNNRIQLNECYYFVYRTPIYPRDSPRYLLCHKTESFYNTLNLTIKCTNVQTLSAIGMSVMHFSCLACVSCIVTWILPQGSRSVNALMQYVRTQTTRVQGAS